MSTRLANFARAGFETLTLEDRELSTLLEQELDRQRNTLSLVASSSTADPSVIVCEATPLGNLTMEGYPGARYHAGAECADRVEELAISRAMSLFGAQYANVQPHSGSAANQIVMLALLSPGDRILGLDIRAGGHLTHGAAASMTGHVFSAASYGVGPGGFLDFEEIEEVARSFRPKLIICGASAYPRIIDFARFRRIADDVGAILLADISHVAGLVAGGVHPSPINYAHVTTLSTYKQLFGPRGGLILMGRDSRMVRTANGDSLAAAVSRGVFPYVQGTPHLGMIAAKARALALAATAEFRELARRIVDNAAALASSFVRLGHNLVSGGTDNHIVLIDLTRLGVSGAEAEAALEAAGILCNRNVIPGDKRGARAASGLRLGTNTVAMRKMDQDGMTLLAEMISDVLLALHDRRRSDRVAAAVEAVRDRVSHLCRRFPITAYELSRTWPIDG